VSTLVQQIMDGLGRGSIYALLAIGIAVIFGVMHLVNFAHGELITVSAYVTYWLASRGLSWWFFAPAIIGTSVVVSMAIELVAFRRVRGAPDFTMLLTSFGIHFVSQALFVMTVGANFQNFDRPDWIFDTWRVAGISLEVVDLATIGVTLVMLGLTVLIMRRTMFGIAIRAAAEDFDTARLMGIRSNRVITGAFALAGALAGVAAVFWLMRSGQASPTAGLTPLLKGVLAALIGGLGSLEGAVLGGFLLGLVEVLLLSRLPSDYAALTEGIIFFAIALLFVFRPQGIIAVNHAERV
jgi:branched-chain amino acid transport system permease protein